MTEAKRGQANSKGRRSTKEAKRDRADSQGATGATEATHSRGARDKESKREPRRRQGGKDKKKEAGARKGGSRSNSDSRTGTPPSGTNRAELKARCEPEARPGSQAPQEKARRCSETAGSRTEWATTSKARPPSAPPRLR